MQTRSVLCIFTRSLFFFLWPNTYLIITLQFCSLYFDKLMLKQAAHEMLLCLEVHGTFSISHAILGFKRRERGKGGAEKKRGWRAEWESVAPGWQRPGKEGRKLPARESSRWLTQHYQKGCWMWNFMLDLAKQPPQFCFSLILALFSPAFP